MYALPPSQLKWYSERRIFKIGLLSVIFILSLSISSRLYIWINSGNLFQNKLKLKKTLGSSSNSMKSSINKTLIERPDYVIPSFRVYIMEKEFGKEVLSYFESCDESRSCEDRNANSHSGAKYFSRSSLKTHEWSNGTLVKDIESANIILIPFEFTLAITGRCGESVNEDLKNKKKECFRKFNLILKQLLEYKYILRKKAILLIMQTWEWLRIGWERFENKMFFKVREDIKKLAESEVFVFVGHFENTFGKEEENVFGKIGWWKLKDGILKNGTQTIVLPYTIQVKIDNHEENNILDIDALFENFQSKAHSLFFMGSPSDNIETRMKMLAYMTDPIIKNLNPFGIMKYNKNDKFPIEHNIPICQNDKKLVENHSLVIPSMPCLMPFEVSKQMNRKNELYLYGLKNSKFNLMLRGDTPTSGKFYDSIAFNMINIFVGITKDLTQYYLPFADVIPYHKFCFFIPPEKFVTEGVTLLHNIVTQTSDEEIKNMLGNLALYKKDILWNTKGSRVVRNVLDEVQQKWEYIMLNLNQTNQ